MRTISPIGSDQSLVLSTTLKTEPPCSEKMKQTSRLKCSRLAHGVHPSTSRLFFHYATRSSLPGTKCVHALMWRAHRYSLLTSDCRHSKKVRMASEISWQMPASTEQCLWNGKPWHTMRDQPGEKTVIGSASCVWMEGESQWQ